MSIVTVDHAADPRLSDYRDLTDVALRRRLEPENGLYIAESAKVIARALDAGHQPRSVLIQDVWLDQITPLLTAETPVYVVTAAVAETLTGYPVHRGALAAMHRPDLTDVRKLIRAIRLGAPTTPTRPRIAVLEGLTDHANVGAVFRSAAALGVKAVLVSPDCADPYYRRSVRVSMGSVFQVPWTRLLRLSAGIDALKESGFVVAGMTLGEGAITLDDLVAEGHDNLALVFGTEGHGLTAATNRRLDRRVTIPMMAGVDSLNVAAASAVAFYATR